MTATFTVTTRRGETRTRRSTSEYPFASETERGRVRFHQTRDAAVAAAGRFGTVHTTTRTAGAPRSTESACFPRDEARCRCGKTPVYDSQGREQWCPDECHKATWQG